MKLYEAQNIIKDVFESSFNKEKYAYFVRSLLKNLQISEFTRTGYNIPKAFTGFISLYERIGKYEDEEGNEIDVLVVKLNKIHSIDFARSKQRSFIRWYLNKKMREAALVAFYSEKSSDWRFSFIKMQYSLEKKKDELTPAKRFSFVVGEKGKSHTAQRQLVNILKNDYAPTLTDIEEAFNIEAISDEFYGKYHELFTNLVEEIEKIINKDKVVKEEFEKQKIKVLDFSKKLLGQIVFLYFLQRKGWLGLNEGAKYGDGDKNFLRNLFNKVKPKENFFNDCLEFLFYDALSRKRVTDYYKKFDTRIPFLNGGLFDPISFYDWEKTDVIIPNKLFSDRKNDEEGFGILDVFDLYNFTVKEDEPLEKEVAIDPEMLGKVFERMLNVKDRKSKGAFYTPREIVHYMAQQSLLYYLENSPLSEGWQTKSDGVLKTTARNNKKLDGIYKKYKQLPYNPKLKERAKALRKAGVLSEVIFWNVVKKKQFMDLDFHRQKIIGNYIVDFYAPELDLVVEIDGSSHDSKVEYDERRDEYLRSLGLNVIHFEDSRIRKDFDNVLSELERYCLEIKHSNRQEKHPVSALRQSHPSERGEWIKDLEKFIHYGEHVIDKDIAIEEGLYSANSNKYEVPESIRNNAAAIDKALENIKICDPAVGSGAFPVGVMNEIVKLRNLLTPFIKSKTNRDSYHFKANAIQNSIYGVDIDTGAVEIAKLRLWLSMVVDENRIDNIEPLPNLEYKIVRGNSLINMPEGSFRDAKLENEIEQLTKHYYKITDKEEKQNQKEIIDGKIQQLLKSASEFSGYDIDFDFKLFFHEVFNKKDGFDVVIGNPPYLRIQGIRKENPRFVDLLVKLYNAATGSFDLYVCFTEKGFSLTNSKGILNYIMPVKWTNSAFGKGLRSFLKRHRAALKIISFSAHQVFNASTYTGIQFFQKNSKLLYYTELNKDLPSKLDIENYISSLTSASFNTFEHNELSNDTWTLTDKNISIVLRKLNSQPYKIKDVFEKFFTGLQTSKDSVYFLMNCKLEKEYVVGFSKELEQNVMIEKGLVKLLLKGGQVHRYEKLKTTNYVIFPYYLKDGKAVLMKESEIKDSFPYGFKYLKKNEMVLKNRENGRLLNDSYWYRYIYPKNLTLFNHAKLICPDISLGGNYAYDEKGQFYDTTTLYGYIKYHEIKHSYKYYLGILNSTICWFFLKNTGTVLANGYFRFMPRYVEVFPLPNIEIEKSQKFEIIVDYILFLKTQSSDTQSFYFEQIIDGMVYELYFEKEIKKAGRDIIKYLQNLPEITDKMSNDKKQKIITEVFNKLYDKNSPIRNNLFYMKSIEEIKIIEESLKK